MSETQISLNLTFDASRATWLRLSAAGAVLVAAILASVLLGIGWASYDSAISGNGVDIQESAQYQLFEIEGRQDSTKYTSSQLDGMDGIGLLRAAGPLAIVGLVLAFLSAGALLAASFVQGWRLDIIANTVVSLATVFLILVVILFPIGVAQFHGEAEGVSEGNGFTFDTTPVSWGAGLVLGILAGAFALGATAAGWLSLRRPEAQ